MSLATRHFAAIVLAAILTTAAGLASGEAATVTWTGASSVNWSVGENWSEATPVSGGSEVVFNNLSTANLATTNDLANLTLSKITVANPSGAVSIGGNAFTVGAGGIDLSTATQNLTISSKATLSGTSSLSVNAGRTLNFTTAPSLAAGSVVSKDGGGQLSIGPMFTVGYGSTSTFNMNAGTLTNSNIRVGESRSDSSVVGTINHTGGTINAGTWLIVGGVDSLSEGVGGIAKGVYNLSGSGVLNVGTLYTGWTNRGEIYQSGGTITATSLDMATDGTTTGRFELSGGLLTVTGNARLGYRSHADFVQTGGTAQIQNLQLGSSLGPGATATYNLNGGVLSVASIAYSSLGPQTFSFDGGTLQANASLTTTLPMTINANGAMIDTQANVVTLHGALDGTGRLTKSGTGTLVLGGTNHYAGGTTVSAGTLQGNTNSLQGDILNNAALGFDQTFDGSYSGILSGAGQMIKTGGGMLTLGGNNSYGGDTSINAGTIRLGHANALGTTAGITTIAAGAALDLGGQTGVAETLSLNGTGVGGNGALTNSSGSAGSVTGSVSAFSDTRIAADNGKITLAGSVSTRNHQLTLAGSGTIEATGGFSIASGGELIKDGSGTLKHSGYITVGPGAKYTHKAGTLNVSGAYGVYVTGSSTADGVLTQTGGTINGTGAYFIIGGSLATGGKAIYNMQGGTLNALNSTFYCGWQSDAEINQTAGDITVRTLDSATDRGNGIYRLKGGTLTVTNEGHLGFGAGLKTDFTQSGGSASFGKLVLGGIGAGGTGNYTINAADGPATLTIGSSGLVVGYSGTGVGNFNVDGGAVTVNGDFQVGRDAATTGTVTQTNGHVTIDSARALRFGNGNSAAGVYNLDGGVLTLANLAFSDSAQQKFNFGGGTLQANGNLNATMPMTINAGGATVDTNGNTVTLGGMLGGDGGLTKTGDGTLTLTAPNAYAGPTTIEHGTLALGPTASIASKVIDVGDAAVFDVSAVGGAFQLANGQTLRGTGSVLGNVTIGNGAIHAPGDSPGIQSVSGNYTLVAGSTLEIELNGTVPGSGYDQIQVGGLVTLAGVLDLELGFTPGLGEVFTLIDSPTAIVGAFEGLPEGAELTRSFGGNVYRFYLSYQGTDVTLTSAVPEPSTLGLLGAAGLAVLAVWRTKGRRRVQRMAT